MLFTPRSAPAPGSSKNGNDAFFKSRVQAKLTMGKPGDVYEREADSKADEVVAGIREAKKAPAEPTFFAPQPVVQPRLQPEAAPENEETVQQKTVAETITPLQTSLASIPEEAVQQSETPENEETVQQQAEAPESQEESPALQMLAADSPAPEPFADFRAPVQAKAEPTAAAFSSPRPLIQQQQEKTSAKEENTEEEVPEKQAEEPVTQLMQASDDENATNPAVQAKDGKAAGDISSQLSASKGGGSPMAESTQQEMSSGFGADFSNVRIHTDANAVQMNRQLGAQAFANGNDIYFNEGKYDPASDSGKHLLAHELTHTVQQGASKPAIQKQDDDQTPVPQDQQPPQNGTTTQQNTGNTGTNTGGNQNTPTGNNTTTTTTTTQTTTQNQPNTHSNTNQHTPTVNNPNAQNNNGVNGNRNGQPNDTVPVNENTGNPSATGNQNGETTTDTNGSTTTANTTSTSGGEAGFPTYEAFKAFVTARKEQSAQFFADKKKELEDSIKLEKENARKAIDAEITRLSETRTTAIESINKSFEDAKLGITAKRDDEIKKANDTADAELKRIDQIILDKKKAAIDKGEEKAQKVTQAGIDEGARSDRETETKVSRVDSIIRSKSSQYSGTENAADVTRAAWDSKPDTVAKIREAGTTIRSKVVTHGEELAANYREDAGNLANKFNDGESDAKDKVTEKRDETIKALRDSAKEALDGLETETTKLKNELNSGTDKQLAALRSLPDQTDAEYDDILRLTTQKVVEHETKTQTEIDDFSAKVGEIFWHKDEVAEAQKDLEKAIGDNESDVTTYIGLVQSKLSSVTTTFTTDLKAAQDKVIPALTQAATTYGTTAEKLKTDTVTAMDGVARESETGTKTIGTSLEQGLQDKINEKETEWNTQLTADIDDMRAKVSEGLESQTEILEQFSANLDEQFNRESSFWDAFTDFFAGFFEGLWEGITSLFWALVDAMGTLLFWIIVLVIVLVILFLVFVVGIAFAVILKVLLIVGIVIGVIAFLYYVGRAIFSEGLSWRERGRLVGRGVFELAFALIGAGVYARLMGWIPRIGRIAAIAARVGGWSRFLRIVARVKDVRAFVRIIDKVDDLERLLQMMDKIKDFDQLIKLLDAGADFNRVIRILSSVGKADDLLALLAKGTEYNRILLMIEKGLELGKADELITLLGRSKDIGKILSVLEGAGDDFLKVVGFLDDAPDLGRMVQAMQKAIDAGVLDKLLTTLGQEGIDIAKVVGVVIKTGADDLASLFALLGKTTEIGKLLGLLDTTTDIGKLISFLTNVTDLGNAITKLEGMAAKMDTFVALVNAAKKVTPDKLLALIEKITDVDKLATVIGKTANVDDLISALAKIDQADLAKFVNYLVVKIKEVNMASFLKHFNTATDTGLLLRLFEAGGSKVGSADLLKLLDDVGDVNDVLRIASQIPGDLENFVRSMKLFQASVSDYIMYLAPLAGAELSDMVFAASKMSTVTFAEFKAMRTYWGSAAVFREALSLSNMTGVKLLQMIQKSGGTGAATSVELLELLKRADSLGDALRLEALMNRAGGNVTRFRELFGWFKRFPFNPLPGPEPNYIDAITGMEVNMDHICGRHTVEKFQWITANLADDTTMFARGSTFESAADVRHLLDQVIAYLDSFVPSKVPTLTNTPVTEYIPSLGRTFTIGVRPGGGGVMIGQFYENAAIHLTSGDLKALFKLFI